MVPIKTLPLFTILIPCADKAPVLSTMLKSICLTAVALSPNIVIAPPNCPAQILGVDDAFFTTNIPETLPVPLTSNLYAGDAVPIPTLPLCPINVFVPSHWNLIFPPPSDKITLLAIADVPAYPPIITLLLPVVIACPALYPIAVLVPPVVIELREYTPTAVLAPAIVLALRA